MGGSSSKRDSAGEASRVGHPYRKVSPRNLAYWLGSSRLSVMENPPAYSQSQECARPRALAPPEAPQESSSQPEAKGPQAPAPPVAPPTPGEALRAIAERTRKVPCPPFESTPWSSDQRILWERAKILYSSEGQKYEVQPESWTDAIQVWQWLIGGCFKIEAALLLAKLGLEDNTSFKLQLAAADHQPCTK